MSASNISKIQKVMSTEATSSDLSDFKRVSDKKSTIFQYQEIKESFKKDKVLMLLKKTSINKIKNFNHLKLYKKQNKGLDLTQSPFPLLKLLSNKMIINNSKHMMKQLLDNNDEIYNKIILKASVSDLKNTKISLKKSGNVKKINIVNSQKQEKSKLSPFLKPSNFRSFSNDQSYSIKTENNFTQSNFKNLMSLNNINTISHHEESTPTQLDEFFNFTKIPPLSELKSHRKFEIKPIENYARYAYKFKKIEDNNQFLNKISEHLNKLKRKSSVLNLNTQPITQEIKQNIKNTKTRNISHDEYIFGNLTKTPVKIIKSSIFLTTNNNNNNIHTLI